MADKTGISWTDATWNPVRGCTRVSEGCRNCYAERVAARFSLAGMPYHVFADQTRTGSKWTGVVRLIPERLPDPLRWKKPRRIFVNSMSDLFHEELADDEIAAVMGAMVLASQHTYQVLTKRPERMRRWFERWSVEACLDVLVRFQLPNGESFPGPRPYNHPTRPEWCDVEGWPIPWIWLGVSVENQEAADERIPELLRTPAAVRFLSCEPLLGDVDLDKPRCDDPHHDDDNGWCIADDGATPYCVECDSERSYGHWLHLDGGIDWVIAGCESGPRARPCSVEWLRSLRDQCAAAGVPYFLKQATRETDHGDPVVVVGPGAKTKAAGVIELPYLDGVQHASFPTVQP